MSKLPRKRHLAERCVVRVSQTLQNMSRTTGRPISESGAIVIVAGAEDQAIVRILDADGEPLEIYTMG